MKNRTEAIAITNEVLNNLTPKACLEALKNVNYDISKLTKTISNSYPEVNGWYYNDTCTTFCNEVIRTHIVTKGIEFVSSTLIC